MRINKEQAQVLMIDIQEKLYPHMEKKEELLQQAIILLEGMKVLGVPMLAARQYPKGLGDTIAELRDYFPHYYDKTSFSCCGAQELADQLRANNRQTVILFGIEAHICVLQTALDLKAAGYTPVVVADAVSTRKKFDYKVALKRLEASGIMLTTVESILFELCAAAGSEAFKAISRLVK